MATQGFAFAAKTLRKNNIPLEAHEINRALKYCDKTMSENKIQAWISQYSEDFYYKRDVKNLDHIEPSRTFYKQKSENSPQLYPHEFLFLICNSVDRLKYVFFKKSFENLID